MITAERQAARIRSFYLKTILRQDIAFFDKEISTGEVVGRMSGDTLLIQDAIGEKVVFQLMLIPYTFAEAREFWKLINYFHSNQFTCLSYMKNFLF